MTKFDPTKPVQTRDGRKARIICTDLNSSNPIVAAVTIDGYEEVLSFNSFGMFLPYGESNLDLINIPEKHVYWINVYKTGLGSLRNYSKAEADSTATSRRIACIRIEYEEGEGL